MREALSAGVRTGLGSDIAGGYTADALSSSRSAVMVSRLREGSRQEVVSAGKTTIGDTESVDRDLSINWKEGLFLATRGGARALDLPIGTFETGAPFDGQLSRYHPESAPYILS